MVTVAARSSASEGGEGSGFVLNGEGEIVTNAHVVTTGEGDAIKRATAGLRRVRRRQPGAARRCSGTTRTPTSRCCGWTPKGLDAAAAAAGRQREGHVGEPVAAIGSPFGQAQSLSVGIVSAVDRSVASLTEFAISGAIQTDAAINPGNSGGPLVGADGRVIGINQQIQSRSGGGEGVGFAVPIDVVKRSVGQLREAGPRPLRVPRRLLGAAVSAARRAFGLEGGQGRVGPGGHPGRAGRQGGPARRQRPRGLPGLAVRPRRRRHHQGRRRSRSRTPTTSSSAIARFKPGETADVEIHRGGETQTVKVKLGERPLGG